MSKKIFVLDTSAIMSLVQDVTTFRDRTYPAFAAVLGDNEIVIPRVALDELDRLKNHDSGEKSKNAREAARQLEHYSGQGSLLEGVETEKGGVLRIAPRPNTDKGVAYDLKANVADHEILATAIEIEDELKASYADSKGAAGNGSEPTVILLTQDRLLRVLAHSVYGVRAEELKSVCAPEFDREIGYQRIEMSGDEIDSVIAAGAYTPQDGIRVNKFYHLVDRDNPEVHYCYCFSRDPEKSSAALLDRANIDFLKVSGEVQGRNIRQKLFLWALMGCGESDPMAHDGIRLLTVMGPAGTGKSFLTLAAAWERVTRGHFERIVVTRPMVDVGKSLGFLPGTLDEKLQPWGGPIEDNLRAIVQVPSPDEGRGGGARRGMQRSPRAFDAKAWLEMEDQLEMVPLTYIRGRTFRRTFVIVEEAQNLERGPLKVLLTRLGEGSFVVVMGDSSQIDNQFLSVRNNGLIHAANAFRDWPQAIHLELDQIVRSDMAEAATRML